MKTYTSKRNHPLLFVGEPSTDPILTAENYTKWYELYLVQPDGSVTEVAVEDLQLVMEQHDDARWVDHLYHPRLIYWLADQLKAEIDERLIEVAIGRWILESGDTGFPVELFNDPRPI